MNIFNWLRREKRTAINGPATAGVQSVAYEQSNTGLTVDEDTALKYSAVYRCIELKSAQIASLPLNIYNNMVKSYDHYAYKLLQNPCPPVRMPTIVFRQAFFANALRYGNGYAEIQRTPYGTPVALWLIRPDRVTPWIEESGELVYLVDQPVAGGQSTIPARDMLHFRLMGDGFEGIPPLRYFAEVIGLGLAANKWAGSLFKNNGKPPMVLTHPGIMSEEAGRKLRQSWNAAYGGIENAGRIALLEEGMDAKELSLSPVDAALIESKRMTVTEICNIFGVPPYLCGDLTKSSYSSNEQQGLDFITYSLRPALVQLEQEYTKLFATDQEATGYYFRHNVDGLLRGDKAARFQTYGTGLQWGIYSVNEVRELEELPPVEGGDMRLIPLNMTPVATDTITRAIAIEVNGLKRLEGKEDFQVRAKEFYEKHDTRLNEMLAPMCEVMKLDIGNTLSILKEHRNRILESNGNLPAILEDLEKSIPNLVKMINKCA